MVHPQLAVQAVAAGSRDRPKPSSDQPDQSQKTEKPERDPKNRLNSNNHVMFNVTREFISLAFSSLPGWISVCATNCLSECSGT